MLVDIPVAGVSVRSPPAESTGDATYEDAKAHLSQV
jgi:hypothetical protein